MDITKYIDRKVDGRAEVIKAGGGYALAFKKWNVNTGEAEEPEIEAVSVEELKKQKSDLQSQIADIDELLADITAIIQLTLLYHNNMLKFKIDEATTALTIAEK